MSITKTPFNTARPVAGVDPTDGQINYLADLLADRDWTTGQAASWTSRAATISIAIDVALGKLSSGNMFLTAPFLGGKVNQALHQGGVDQLTKPGASAMIDWLQTCPRKPAELSAGARRNVEAEKNSRVEAPEVPAGRYAIETGEGAANELAFYKVDRPTEGRWAGRVFVKLMRSDEEVRLSWATTKAVLAKIAEAGAEDASKRYGREIGECGVCGRTLTNDDSRAQGIGPKCAEKF
ncbi:hypothetical protein SEA_YAGO84_40 [Gordonia phage Yago84]|nr:hypothetical protein SEA_YAGO84_40 [Gordonia phage Yago84]WIC90022.1 hypothetical protein SEA_SISKO_40 [Gordonia phage Sisko]